MKTRRIAIVAFLLATVLTLGIGYAAISGVLGISGRATFNGTAVTQSEVTKALQFTNAVGDENCVANVTQDGTGHSADMTVTFNDANGIIGDKFVAVATYTISYSSTVTNLPDVKLTMPTPAITPSNGSDCWSIAVDWTGDKTLSVGEETTITVTVTYENKDPVEVNQISANIAVPIPYATIEA